MKCMIDELEYTIEEQGNGKYVYLEDVDVSVFGICMYAKQLIVIHQDMSREMKERVLRHELCHAFMYSRGFAGEQMSEEQVCNFMAAVSEHIENIVVKYFVGKDGE